MSCLVFPHLHTRTEITLGLCPVPCVPALLGKNPRAIGWLQPEVRVLPVLNYFLLADCWEAILLLQEWYHHGRQSDLTGSSSDRQALWTRSGSKVRKFFKSLQEKDSTSFCLGGQIKLSHWAGLPLLHPHPATRPALAMGGVWDKATMQDNATRWPWGGLCLPSTQNLTPCTSDCFPRNSPRDERLFPSSRGPGKAYTCHPRIQACPPSSKDQTVGS